MQTTQKKFLTRFLCSDFCPPSVHPTNTVLSVSTLFSLLTSLVGVEQQVQPVDNSDNTALLQNLYFLLLLFSMCSVRIIIYD